MKAAAFDYVRTATLDETLRILSERGEGARIIAGGQSLAPALNLRLAAPDLLVDIGGLTQLRYIEPTSNGVNIGALTRHVDIARSDWIASYCPLLTRAIAHVAHPAIRNRGTLGGSLAQADPAAELPACMVALDAVIVTTGASGERRIAARDFFLGVYETALRPDEVLTGVEIGGLDAGRAYGFAELSRRRGDFAIVGLALAARRRETRLDDIELVYFGVSDRPTPAPGAAAALARQDMDAARAALAADLNPVADAQASSAMRLRLAGVLMERAFAEAGEATT